MKFPFDFLVFDVEANQPSGRIIEIGAVRVSRTGEIAPAPFVRFVNPGEPIHEDIRQLCNLSPMSLHEIQQSPPLSFAADELYAYATAETKNICLTSWGNFDITELHQQNPQTKFRRKGIDLKSIAIWEMARLGIKGTASLAAACAAFGVEVVGPKHRALPDALTTANLLVALVNKSKQFKANIKLLADSLA